MKAIITSLFLLSTFFYASAQQLSYSKTQVNDTNTTGLIIIEKSNTNSNKTKSTPSLYLDTVFTLNSELPIYPNIKINQVNYKNIGIEPKSVIDRTYGELNSITNTFFNFTARNNFETVYKIKNAAFYEANRNTPFSSLYNSAL